MYKKVKYMLYISIAIFLILATVMIFNLSDRQTQKKQQEFEQQDLQRKLEEVQKYQSSSASEDNPSMNQRSENEITTTDGIDFIPESEQKDINKVKEESAAEERSLPGEKEIFYAVRSSKFSTINTKDEKFGLITEDKDANLKVLAQILDKSNILLYVFNIEDGKVLWQKKITNKDQKSIKPSELKFSKNTIDLSIAETETKADQSFTFKLDEDKSNEENLVFELENSTITQRDILFANKTKAKDVLSINTFKVNNVPFHIVVHSDFKNSPSYSKYVNRKFYLYKENGNELKFCSALFERSSLKNDHVQELISVSQTPKTTVITYNGKGSLTKTIFNSKLVGPYAKFPPGNSLYLGEKSYVEDSNYDLEISEIY